MKELTTEQKDAVITEFIEDANGEHLMKLANFLLLRLAKEAIQMNAEVINMSTSIHPKGVDERRDVALIVFQKRESENKVDDLASLLQAAPDMLKALQETDKDLCVLEGNMFAIEKKDPRAEGMTEIVRKWRKRNQKAINKALGE